MAVSQMQHAPFTDLDSLIVSIANGSQQALAELYHQTSPGVYAFALSVLKNSHDAEDVLHDCFVSVWSNSGNYHSQGKPMAWILTITRNLCLKVLRDRAKTTPLDTEDWKEHIHLSTEMTVDDKVVLEQCMEQLSDDERQIVVLHAVAGFKHRVISQFLDLALPTVLSKYHRALKKMREQL